MLTLFFYIALFYVAIRMLIWSIKSAWGIAKIIAFAVLLPVLIIGLALAGMFMLALGLIVLMAIIATIGGLVLT